MLGSMGTKGGIVLYHIRYGGYGITIGCCAICGVIGCCQPTCWLISVGLITKLGCGWICYTSTPTCVIGVFGITNYILSYSFINCFSLSSTNGQFLNSCPTCIICT
jgi:hypothetical protein